MNAPKHFLAELRTLDEALSVRFVKWAESDGEHAWPIKGSPFIVDATKMRHPGRFVVYERNRVNGRDERVFDVCHPDGEFMHLDRRTFAGLEVRRNWSAMGAKGLEEHRRETDIQEQRIRKAEMTSALESDNDWCEAMERVFREDTGHAGVFAMGSPDHPTPALTRKSSGSDVRSLPSTPHRLPKTPDLSLYAD